MASTQFRQVTHGELQRFCNPKKQHVGVGPATQTCVDLTVLDICKKTVQSKRRTSKHMATRPKFTPRRLPLNRKGMTGKEHKTHNCRSAKMVLSNQVFAPWIGAHGWCPRRRISTPGLTAKLVQGLDHRLAVGIRKPTSFSLLKDWPRRPSLAGPLIQVSGSWVNFFALGIYRFDI